MDISGVNLIVGVRGLRDVRGVISGVTCMDFMYISDAISGASSGASSGVNLMDIMGMDISGALSGVICNLMDIMGMDITGAER